VNDCAGVAIILCEGGQHGFVALFHSQAVVSLATTVSVLAMPIALAQDQAKARHVGAAVIDNNEQRFIIANDLAISKMSLSIMADPTGDVDRDFVAVMMPTIKAPSIPLTPSSNTVIMRSFGVWLRASSRSGSTRCR